MSTIILLIIAYISVIVGNLFIAFNGNSWRTWGYLICIFANVLFMLHGFFIQYTNIVWIFPIYTVINIIGLFNTQRICRECGQRIYKSIRAS
jgi:cobalamin biosynthesis protein CobD/CbiB